MFREQRKKEMDEQIKKLKEERRKKEAKGNYHYKFSKLTPKKFTYKIKCRKKRLLHTS